ncbi:MAG: damage repair endonuclease UvsE [Solirubrobacterales bacterium]|nr:damage repair endonuclease UvsE [Solirubrobacterales bacterium]
MRLGFAVKIIGEGGLPTGDARRWQSGPHLRVSLAMLDDALDYLERHDIRMYRFSASIAPYATHPDLPQFHDQVEECREELAAFGERSRAADVRLSSHPGQYIVLNSETQSTRDGAVRDLELQAAMMDAMGLGPEAVVVLHVGGTAGGIEASFDRFERGLELLSPAARARLVIENDDRSFALGHVLELCRRTGLRAVWDVHHHHCVDPDDIPDHEALGLAMATWPAGVVPKMHFSSPKTQMEEVRKKVGRRVEKSWALPPLRAHADLIDPIAFDLFLRETVRGREVDVMLEAKGKDLALLRLRSQLGRAPDALPAAAASD